MTAVVWTCLLLRGVSPEDSVSEYGEYDPSNGGSYDYVDYRDIHASLEDTRVKCGLSNLPSETAGGDAKQCCENGGWLFEDIFGCPERQVKD